MFAVVFVSSLGSFLSRKTADILFTHNNLVWRFVTFSVSPSSPASKWPMLLRKLVCFSGNPEAVPRVLGTKNDGHIPNFIRANIVVTRHAVRAFANSSEIELPGRNPNFDPFRERYFPRNVARLCRSSLIDIGHCLGCSIPKRQSVVKTYGYAR